MVILGSFKSNMPPVDWRPEFPKLGYATFQFPDGVRGDRWARWFQFPFLLVAVLWTIYTEKCQILLTVYPDMIYLFTGYLASVITGKPLFTYFHNTLVEARPSSQFAHWLQARVFKQSRCVFVANDGMQQFYAQHYPEIPCETLFATFNEQVPSFDSAAPALRRTHTPLRLAFSGNINASNEGAVKVISKMLRELPDVTVKVYTGTNQQVVRNLGFDGERVEITSVSRDILISKLQEADIVLLPHGFTENFSIEEERTIFPIKTLEYLLCGRPMVALVPEDTYLCDFLRQHDCALLLTQPNVEAMKQAIQRVQTDQVLREYLVKNALNAVQQFYAPTVASKLREGIRQHLGLEVDSDTPHA